MTSLTSTAQVDMTASFQKEHKQHFHKTESSDFGFMDFLFEEDTTENEEDNLFIPFSFTQFSSYLFQRADVLKSSSALSITKAIAFLKTPIFLTFRNIRL
jgi:hypothetical protein